METETLTGTDGVRGPILTEADYRKFEGKVLNPESDVTLFKIGDVPVRLRPLKGKLERQLLRLTTEAVTRWNDAKSTQDAVVFVQAAEAIYAGLCAATAVIAAHYDIPKASPEWAEENFDDGEMFDIVRKQLEVGSQNSFMRRGVLFSLRIVQETFAGLEEADPSKIREYAAQIFTSLGTPASSAPSVSPGGSPMTNSSSATPSDS